jgi:hypothetical protein
MARFIVDPKRRLAIVSLLCAAALGLSACGDDDDDGGDGKKANKPEQTQTTSVPTDPREQFNELLERKLKEKDRTEAQIDCVQNDLNDRLSDSQIEGYIDSLQAGEGAGDLIELLKDAAEKCKNA